MDINVNYRSGGGVDVFLAGEITESTYEKDRNMIIGIIEENDIIDFDLSGITHLDNAGYQLISFLKMNFYLFGKRIKINNMSGEIFKFNQRHQDRSRTGNKTIAGF